MTSKIPTHVTGVQRVEAHGGALTWWPDARLLRLESVNPHGTLDGAAALRLVAALNGWVGDSDEPFGVLVDCSRIEDADAAWRALWTECFKSHIDRIRVAWYGEATLHMQVMVRMFTTGLNVDGSFIGAGLADEGEARAWLRRQQIDA